MIVLAWLSTACGSPAPPRMPAPAPLMQRVQIDGPGAFALRAGDRVAVIVDGRRLGTAVYDGSQQLVRAEGAAGAWLRDVRAADIANVEVVKGAGAAREYGLRDGEVGAVIITMRHPPADSSQAGRREESVP